MCEVKVMGWEVVREGGENWRPGRGEEPDSSWDSWGEGRGGTKRGTNIGGRV